MRLKLIALMGAAAVAAPAFGAPIQFSALLKEDIGYGTNPFMRAGVNDGALLVSLAISPKFLYQTARSSTILSGSYDRDSYTNGLGYTDGLNASLNRTDQLSQHLSSIIAANYSTTNKATIPDPSDPDSFDPLNIGRRSNRLTGSYHIQWQASASDNFSYGANASQLSYGGRGSTVNGIASGYTQYGVDGSYNHVVDARTSVGLQASLTAVHSHLYPRSRAIQPSVSVKRQLNAIWSLDGHVGLVLQSIYGPLPRTSKSLGFGVSICAAYPLTHLCASAERSSAPSGYGGIRTNANLSLSLTQTLSARSRFTLNTNYSKSDANQAEAVVAVASGKSLVSNAEYDRDLTQRISFGFGGRYQWREASRTGTAHAMAATVHLSAKLGRM